MIFLLALLGGLLLNVLPCTLPILSLKAMSLHDNGWFAAGMMSVFLLLAASAASLGLVWGGQLQYQPFVITLAGITFAAGLSYLGVWEIPTPGFREQTGAFGKGMLATLLGSACSGPFLAPVFASTLNQPPGFTFALITCVGLGMTAPYWLLAFVPATRRLIPKPGTWMVTLKQIAGFALLAAAIWLLRGVSDRWLFPTLILFLAIGLGCWFRTRIGLAIALLLAITPFTWAVDEQLPWQPYDDVRLYEALNQERVTLVCFSTKLCLTCDLNMTVLNSRPVRQAIDRHHVTTLYADVANPQAASLLRNLGYSSVPVLAVYPRRGKPIILPDLITQKSVIAAIDEAAN